MNHFVLGDGGVLIIRTNDYDYKRIGRNKLMF